MTDHNAQAIREVLKSLSTLYHSRGETVDVRPLEQAPVAMQKMTMGFASPEEAGQNEFVCVPCKRETVDLEHITYDEFVMVAANICSHEVEHINVSDLGSIEKFALQYKDNVMTAMNVRNLVEDQYIDHQRTDRLPGIELAHAKFVKIMMARQDPIDEMPPHKAMLSGIRHITWCGFAKGYEDADKVVRGFLAWAREQLLEAKNAHSVGERNEIARKILHALLEYVPDQEELENEAKGRAREPSDNAEQPDEQVSSEEAAEEVEEIEDAIAPPEAPEDEDETEQDEGEPQQDKGDELGETGETPDEEVDEEEDVSETDDVDPEASDKEHEDGQNKPDEDMEEEDGSSGASGDEEKEEEGDEEEGAGDASDEESVEDSEEDEGGVGGQDEDGEEEEGETNEGAESEEPETNEEGAGEEETEDDAQEDTVGEDSSGEVGSDIEDDSVEESQSSFDQDPEPEDDHSSGESSSEPGDSTLEDVMDEIEELADRSNFGDWNDIDRDFSEAERFFSTKAERARDLSHELKELEDNDSMVSKKKRRDERIQKASNDDIREIKNSRMVKDIEEAFKNIKTRDIVIADEQGDRLHTPNYIERQVTGDTTRRDILRRRKKVEIGDRVIGVAVDMSGSVDEREAKVALGSLYKATEVIGDEFAASAFQKNSTPLITGLDEYFDWEHLSSLRSGGNTPTADGILETINLIKDSTMPEKVIMVITDGKPNVTPSNSRYTNMDAVEGACAAVQEAKKEGIKVIGIGVGNVDHGTMNQMFEGNYVMTGEAGMARKLVEQYKKQMEFSDEVGTF